MYPTVASLITIFTDKPKLSKMFTYIVFEMFIKVLFIESFLTSTVILSHAVFALKTLTVIKNLLLLILIIYVTDSVLPIVDFKILLENERRNFQLVSLAVSDLGGIPAMITPEDMSNTIPNEKVQWI